MWFITYRYLFFHRPLPDQPYRPTAFNLIKPEIFELYDVCTNHPKLQAEDKQRSNEKHQENEKAKGIKETCQNENQNTSDSGRNKTDSKKKSGEEKEVTGVGKSVYKLHKDACSAYRIWF